MKQTIEYGPATNVWIRPNPAWIERGGGECPINAGDEVEVRLRSGLLERRTDQHLRRWTHASASPIAAVPESDIVAYRVWTTKQELATADGVVVRDTADSIEAHLRAESALDVQHGGDHYKTMPIQPVEFIHANGIGFCEGAVIKYVTRHKAKNGAEDLRKARHFIDLLLELEYGVKP